MLIQVDVDSTLYDADPLFSKVANEQGINWPDRDNGWRKAEEVLFYDGTPCTVDDLLKVFRKCHSAEMVQYNVPYESSASVLKRISEDHSDVQIAYVSDRNSQQTSALTQWLEDNDFLHTSDQVVVATKDKREWMRANKPSIVIDDRVRTILLARYELGSYVATLTHPHNINLKNEAEGVYFVNNWDEMYPVLEELITKVETKVKV